MLMQSPESKEEPETPKKKQLEASKSPLESMPVNKQVKDTYVDNEPTNEIEKPLTSSGNESNAVLEASDVSNPKNKNEQDSLPTKTVSPNILSKSGPPKAGATTDTPKEIAPNKLQDEEVSSSPVSQKDSKTIIPANKATPPIKNINSSLPGVGEDIKLESTKRPVEVPKPALVKPNEQEADPKRGGQITAPKKEIPTGSISSVPEETNPKATLPKSDLNTTEKQQQNNKDVAEKQTTSLLGVPKITEPHQRDTQKHSTDGAGNKNLLPQKRTTQLSPGDSPQSIIDTKKLLKPVQVGKHIH